MLRSRGPTKGLAKSAANGLATSKAIGCSQELVEAASEVQEGAGLHAACLPCEQRMALENAISSNCVEMASQNHLEIYRMWVLIVMADTVHSLPLPTGLTRSKEQSQVLGSYRVNCKRSCTKSSYLIALTIVSHQTGIAEAHFKACSCSQL